MKKVFLVAAASLFVIGQALAQGQTPPPAGAGTANQPNAAQSKQTTKAPAANSQKTAVPAQGKKVASAKAKSSKHMSSKRSAHRMARSHKRHVASGKMTQGQPQQQGFGFGPPQQRQAFAPRQPQKLTCKKGQKPDGITCM
jgi:hypothetical protein